MVATGIVVFTLTASISENFNCHPIRSPKLTVFVKEKNKVDSISEHLENVRNLDKLVCRPLEKLHRDFVISCSNNKNEPWKPNEKFWHYSNIKSASLYQWLQKFKYGNADGGQSHVSNVNSSFERLHVSNSKQ